MNTHDQAVSLNRPRIESGRVFFEIAGEAEIVECAISRGALEDLSEARCARPADLLAQFTRLQKRIEGLARAKLLARPEALTGRLNLWADDMSPQPTGTGESRTQAGTGHTV